jgi:hypothetical protein
MDRSTAHVADSLARLRSAESSDLVAEAATALSPSEAVDNGAAECQDAGFLARQPRTGMTKAAYFLGLSFSRAWLPRVKNPGLFSLHKNRQPQSGRGLSR